MAGTPGDGAVQIQVKDGGKTVTSASGEPGKEISLKLDKPILWTPDTPYLYGLTVSLKAGGSDDSVESYFAMRKIALGKDDGGITRILLNGKFVPQIGPLDQGYWPDGLYTAPSDAALRFDIEVMKEYGFNMARKHLKVEPDRWYYWCDKLGLLVWQDMPTAWQDAPETKRQFEAELAEMIIGLHNHPSIVMWIPFNETWGQYDQPRITALVRSLDSSRLVNHDSGAGVGGKDDKVGDIVDDHCYPAPGDTKPEEKRAAVFGEFGGLGYNVPGHCWNKVSWSYVGYKDLESLHAAYFDLYKVLFQRVKSPGVSGAVYTQLTDVEAENNGLMTYDREVMKIKPTAAAIHRDGRKLLESK